MKTKHIEERKERMRFIRDNIGFGTPIAQFRVDKGHKNGPEVHQITSTGCINIFNAITKKWVTTLIARPEQITRYYRWSGKDIPSQIVFEVLPLAKKHFEKGWNYK